MKKLYIIIVVLSVIGIALFFYFLPRSRERNDIFYHTIVTYEDVIYKNVKDDELTLDIIMPTTEVYSETPVLVFIHGGSFTEGQKSDLTMDLGRDIVTDILDAGYAIISVEYRLLYGDNVFPNNLIDVKDSLRYLISVSDDYNFDIDNFGIWGEGSGGYLALTAGYSASGVDLGDYTLRNYSYDIKYVIDFSGVTEISSLYDLEIMNNQELSEIQGILDELYGTAEFDIYNLSVLDYASINLYSPISYVSVDTIPTLIIHGASDEIVDLSQSDLLVTKLDEYNIEYEYHKILGANHDLNNIISSEIESIKAYVLEFMEGYYVS
ncbi:MAG: alpha/beta hydrolase [Tenericutes bacterium]|nr:alpha/beta hydrolase [Mycoplasmatota bacterium]